jgi:hypothetical protein
VTVWSGNEIDNALLSPNGTLALTTQSAEVSDRRLAWIDEKGQPQPIPGTTRNFVDIAISPDGGRVLAPLDNSRSAELASEVTVQDLGRRTSTRIPIQGALTGIIWSRDGQRLTYGLLSNGAFSLWEGRSDGTGEPVKLYSSPASRTVLTPKCWSPDGKTLSTDLTDVGANKAIGYLLAQDAEAKQWVAKPYSRPTTQESVGMFSEDGKWVLLWSFQFERYELYVQRFTGDGDADAKAGRVRVTTNGARNAWWSPGGKEIRYLDSDSQVWSLQVKLEPTFSATEPKLLYSIKDLKARAATFAPDGRLMVVLQGESDRTTKKVDLIINFLAELRAKMAAGK